MPPDFCSDPRMLAPPQPLRRTDRGWRVSYCTRPIEAAPYARCVGEWLEHWALATPDALAFAEPAPAAAGCS